jgi:quinol monooxygenase YgiN
MTFEPSKVEEFLENFHENKQHIRNFEGVEHLSLLKDKKDDNVFFTYSIWESEQHLENYRHSELFQSVWAKTKPLFTKKAEAWSVDALVKLD